MLKFSMLLLCFETQLTFGIASRRLQKPRTFVHYIHPTGCTRIGNLLLCLGSFWCKPALTDPSLKKTCSLGTSVYSHSFFLTRALHGLSQPTFPKRSCYTMSIYLIGYAYLNQVVNRKMAYNMLCFTDNIYEGPVLKVLTQKGISSTLLLEASSPLFLELALFHPHVSALRLCPFQNT